MKWEDDIDESDPQYWANYICPECHAYTDGTFGMIEPPIRVGRHDWLYGLVCEKCNASLLDGEDTRL